MYIDNRANLHAAVANPSPDASRSHCAHHIRESFNTASDTDAIARSRLSALAPCITTSSAEAYAWGTPISSMYAQSSGTLSS